MLLQRNGLSKDVGERCGNPRSVGAGGDLEKLGAGGF